MGCCVSRAADDDDNRQSAVAGGKPFKRTGLHWTADSSITQAQLESQRNVFWETAPSYEGRAEIWQALHAAMTSPDIRMAQSILDAANIIIPTGNPAEGCYDELGNRYVIPMYCLVDPSNLIVPENETDHQQEDQHRDDNDTTGMIASTSVPAQTKREGDHGDGEEDDSSHHHHHHDDQPEEKKSLSSDIPLTTAAAAATATAVASALITITVRLSTAQDIKVDISKTDETVSSLRTRIYMQSPNISPQTHTIRLIYLGRVLQDEDRIIYEGVGAGDSIPDQQQKSVIIATGAVIQALVSKK
ncbi:hypothetical protein BDA99DRAFT_39828 [Phascolomyces articulosus]|uniref:Ubiquitin-like domain-containing protein n=1 Tax=Phascolomyces articulosus TaxID=60185 RepID=A0AAD5K1R6_9FUNG|nr:hypothetical protein BDA99DRAFT_39828 [Phascolomyces articulosus]